MSHTTPAHAGSGASWFASPPPAASRSDLLEGLEHATSTSTRARVTGRMTTVLAKAASQVQHVRAVMIAREVSADGWCSPERKL